MGVRWTTYKLRLSLILFLLNWWSCYSLNPEGNLIISTITTSLSYSKFIYVHVCIIVSVRFDIGLALLDFRAGVSHDPYGAFVSWNPDDLDPCSWANVHCVDGNVQVL